MSIYSFNKNVLNTHYVLHTGYTGVNKLDTVNAFLEPGSLVWGDRHEIIKNIIYNCNYD